MSNPQLSAYLDKVKIDHANHDDLELMLGNELASWSSWSGDVLLRVLSYALEDANFHTESEVIDALHDLVCEDNDNLRDIEDAAAAVLRGEAPAPVTLEAPLENPQLTRIADDLDGIRAALEAQQPVAVGWEYDLVGPAVNAAALNAAQDVGGWEVFKLAMHNDGPLFVLRRPRQQPAPAQDAPEEWADYAAMQEAFDAQDAGDGRDMVYDIGNCSASALMLPSKRDGN